jgi:hypothetical protein
VREDVNVEDTDTVGGERERKRNLSYRKRKMAIKHDEEIAQNKMKVDTLLGDTGKKGWVLKKRNTESHNRKKDSLYCRVHAGGDKWRRVTGRCLYCRAPAVG